MVVNATQQWQYKPNDSNLPLIPYVSYPPLAQPSPALTLSQTSGTRSAKDLGFGKDSIPAWHLHSGNSV